MVSAIIPAFNEEVTIGEIVKSVFAHPYISEVLVVDDGSEDGTAKVAGEAGARVISLRENMGKAGAMDAGVKAAENQIIFFLDGDVTGLSNEAISTIIGPVVSGKLEMHVGILERPLLSLFSKKVFYVLPVLSGMRALTKTLWYKVPRAYRDGFRIEIALNHAARKWGKGTGYEIIGGLTHRIKEKKHGLLLGLWHRARMIAQLVHITLVLYVWNPFRSPFIKLRKAVKVEFNRLG